MLASGLTDLAKIWLSARLPFDSGHLMMTDKRGEPRRRYEHSFKRQVVAETLVEGATIAGIALRHGLNANLVFNWKKDQRFNGGCQRRSKNRPFGGAKVCHFLFGVTRRHEWRPVSRAPQIAGG